MKILIVDDEELARERLHDLLREIDDTYDLDEAENGKQALEKINQGPPDIILLDIRMPVMDGLETAQHLAEIVAGLFRVSPAARTQIVHDTTQIGDPIECLIT